MLADSDSGLDVDGLIFVETVENGGPYTETTPDGLTWHFMVRDGNDQLVWRDGDWNGHIRADLASIRDEGVPLGLLNSVGGASEESRHRGNYDTVWREL